MITRIARLGARGADRWTTRIIAVDAQEIPTTRQSYRGGLPIDSPVTHSHAAWRHPGSKADSSSRSGRALITDICCTC
ncbi:hypothetical protein EF294_16655 [Gordonia oryzae]|uniref:Uncharacterized protein n=1 Tax=Gordonia oryzae TaxID=2487349 RepID=A0A3N4G7H5_9ACTN|nr:hypothetical protein EF294_16655 [Gordonia oryzae]